MKLFIDGPVGQLEAHLWVPAESAPQAVAVFCHPHPLGGGTMQNNVVHRAARGLHDAGLAVLRFNFRGVEESAGVHDGEGAEELDFSAALQWMRARFPETRLWAGGFSFGSRTVLGRLPEEPDIERIVLVAVPVKSYPEIDVAAADRPGLIVMAENDEYGTLPLLKERFPKLHPGLLTDEILGVGHFFEGKTAELRERVRDYALSSL